MSNTEFPKSAKRSRGKRVHISDKQGEEIKKFSEESAKKGVLPGSEEFMRGLKKILNEDTGMETRVACEIGVKGVSGHVMIEKGREKEPWWMHILSTKYPTDALRQFNMSELELLIKDLCANTGFVCTTIPRNKDGRVTVLREIIGLAIKKNHSLENCPFYEHFDLEGLDGKDCINCGRDCLKETKEAPRAVEKTYQLFDNDPHSYTDRDIPDNAYDATKEEP